MVVGLPFLSRMEPRPARRDAVGIRPESGPRGWTAGRAGRTVARMITGTDFIGIPSRDSERARTFYQELLGLRPDPKARFEQWAGETCYSIWEPEKVGFPFAPEGIGALRTDDLPADRARLEAEGVPFLGDTIDTGVCHMAIFQDPDGNTIYLHQRYAPH